jgi:hypothetical protein
MAGMAAQDILYAHLLYRSLERALRAQNNKIAPFDPSNLFDNEALYDFVCEGI